MSSGTPRPAPLVIRSGMADVRWLCGVLGRGWPPTVRVIYFCSRELDVRPIVDDGLGRNITGQA